MTAGSDLQSAINVMSATPGRVVLCLNPGMTYRGKFTVAPRADTGWRVIRADVQPSAIGVRQRPSTAAGLPQVIGNGGPSEAPITITGSKVALVELDVMTDVLKPSGGPGAVVALGTSRETSAAELPQYVLLDRLYIHGHPGAHYTRRGVYMGGRDVVIRDSWIDEIHDNGFDSQAIGGWQGGPLLVENNYLAGASENVMFGGVPAPSVPRGIVTDVTFQGNHVRKPFAWKGQGYAAKNLFEMKAAQRLLITGNVFEGSWSEGQSGSGVYFTSSSQDGTFCRTWCVTTDVTFIGNLVKDTNIPFALSASQGSTNRPDSSVSRVHVEGNLFERVALAPFGSGGGRHLPLYAQAGHLLSDITIRGNTWTVAGGSVTTCIEFTASPNPTIVRFVWDRNVCDSGTYGPIRSSAATGGGAFALHTPGAVIGPNHYTGAPKTGYPAGTTWGATAPAGVGVDAPALRARLAGVVVLP
jgi:hypothetical protein